MKSLSQSELTMFKECRRKWWLTYVRRLLPKRGDRKFARDTGSLVHAVVACWYEGNSKAYVLKFMEDLIAADEAALEVRRVIDPETGLRDLTDEDWAEWLKTVAYGRAMVTGFLDWVEDEGIDAGLVDFIPEAEVIVPLVPGEVQLVGKLDQRMTDTFRGDRVFNEVKTVGGFGDIEGTVQINEQLLHYHLLEQLSEPDGVPSAGVYVTMIRRLKRRGNAKPPFYKRIKVYHSKDQLRSYYRRVMGTWDDMKAVLTKLEAGADPLEVVYPRPDRSCTWKCPFFKVCPMFDDKADDAEGYLAEFFAEGDPYARYDSDLEEGGEE